MKSKSLKNDTTLDSPKVRENRGIFGKLRRPKISIIVPVVNDGRYLNRCLDSILTSDFAEYDVFVAMGATFDNTRDIAKEYAGKYARIHVIKAESQMAAITRSVTLSMGKYIMFISPYDQITSDTLSKYYERNNGRAAIIDLVKYSREQKHLEATGTEGIEIQNLKLRTLLAEGYSQADSYIDRIQAHIPYGTVRKTLAIRERLSLL